MPAQPRNGRPAAEVRPQDKPAHPRITLRLGVAGQRELPVAVRAALAGHLGAVLTTVERQLHSVAQQDKATPTPLYDAKLRPLLRLVTGLADGADLLAGQVFLDTSAPDVQRELAAVLPFDTATFRDRSPVADVAAFEAQRAQCAYVLELDGIWRPKDTGREEADALAADCRGRAYRQQGAVLLRHCDLLIAVTRRDAQHKAGGTGETLRMAVELGVPVLWIDPATLTTQLLRTPEEWLESNAAARRSPPDWQPELERCVADLLSSAMHARRGHRHARQPHDQHPQRHPHQDYLGRVLDELFADQLPRPTRRARLWNRFFALFKLKPKRAAETVTPPYRETGPVAAYRRRAADLSAYFIGHYRGSILLNYAFAALAVLVATVVLVLMILFQQLSGALLGGMVVLAGFKLYLVVTIHRTTHAANHRGWSELATDTRYLSEKLRPLAFMLPLGSLRSPWLGAEPYATRIEKQSVVDWIAEACIRQLPALPALGAVSAEGTPGNTVRADPHAALQRHCLPWIQHQIKYHSGNAATLERMDAAFETLTSRLSALVIAVVGLDILVLVYELYAYLHGHHHAEWLLGALLVSLTAIIPAVMASLNGIRFQSECRRLFDRSRFMGNILQEQHDGIQRLIGDIDADQAQGASARGAWTQPALLRAETLATFTVGESAEWSVLYAKHMFDA